MTLSHADGFFTVGESHVTCQDYVRCGIFPDGCRVYTIVSDGCSSSKDADIGARLMVLAAEEYIINRNSPLDPQTCFKYINEAARISADAIGLHHMCLDATLIIAIETATQILVYKMGDGVVAFRRRDRTWGYEYHEFVSGAPYYPNYLVDHGRHDAYRSQMAGPVICTTSDGSGEEHHAAITLQDYAKTIGIPIVYQKEHIDMVVLMTDGVCSFRKGSDPVALPVVIQQIIGMYPPVGDWAKRFLKSSCSKHGWQHDDDFGIGAIFVD